MNRNRTMPFVVAAVLALAGCGGSDGEDIASRTTPEPTAAATTSPTPTPTASPEATAVAESTPARGKCEEGKYEPGEPTEHEHPDSNFYAPDAERFPTKDDLDQLLLHDNAVVVTYAADTPKKTRDRLYEWTYADVKQRTPIVVPDDSPDALPVRAVIATKELRCGSFNWKKLTAFANRTDIPPVQPGQG